MKSVISLLTALALLTLALSCSTSKAQGNATANKQICQITTSAQCGMCATRIETTLSKVKGVKTTKIDLKNRRVSVQYDATKTSPDALRQAIAAAGYDADQLAANPTAYEKLPACCKKGGHD